MTDWKILSTTFTVIFLTELVDTSQVATMMFSSEHPGARWLVFAGAAAALVLSAGVGVLAGAWVGHYLPEKAGRMFAGVGFIILGLWTLKGALPS